MAKHFRRGAGGLYERHPALNRRAIIVPQCSDSNSVSSVVFARPQYANNKALSTINADIRLTLGQMHDGGYSGVASERPERTSRRMTPRRSLRGACQRIPGLNGLPLRRRVP